MSSRNAASLTEAREHNSTTGGSAKKAVAEEMRHPNKDNSKRLAEMQAEMKRRERQEPLRRRILAALAESPSTSRVLAETVEAAVESVSRQLKSLREANLVQNQTVFGDGRLRLYELTPEGELQLSRHRAFGTPAIAPPVPGRSEIIEFLRAALQDAVTMRRKTNRLEDASTRLRIVLEQARIAQAEDLWVEAMIELATTLRQDGRIDEANGLLSTLEEISLGRHDEISREMVLPAAAHYAYAIGRLRDERGENSEQRAAYLTAAALHYAQLADTHAGGSQAAWRQRQAWSIVALANNLRTRSRFEDALECSHRALQAFDQLEDDYGRSRSLFMSGFCLRLLGDFDGAWGYLEKAHTLAETNGFERFQADALLQLGEVRRCQGKLEIAGELLDEALERAAYMGLMVIQGFAQSARGAVYYQLRDIDKATTTLGQAHGLFGACDHCEGLALNTRRRATVARRTSAQSATVTVDVRDFIAFARERYVQLRSPAGIAACDIELGRLELHYDDKVNVMKSLTLLLDDPDQAHLLERDPWVPRVLHEFATEADEGGGFFERTGRLLRDAERWLAHRIGHSEDTIQQAYRRLETRDPDEMGGEARRYAVVVETPERSELIEC
jgi:tetratricopeptide (TPR) repeat protein